MPIFMFNIFCIPIQNTSKGSVPRLENINEVAPKEKRKQLIIYKI